MKTIYHILRFYRIASLLVRHSPLIAETSPLWERGDAETLLNFFKSESGRKFMDIMRHKSYRAAVDACGASTSTLQQAAGFHNGFRAALAVMVTLSASGEPQSLLLGDHSTGQDDTVNQE